MKFRHCNQGFKQTRRADKSGLLYQRYQRNIIKIRSSEQNYELIFNANPFRILNENSCSDFLSFDAAQCKFNMLFD